MSKQYNFTKENMARGVRPETWWNRGLQLSPERIREAMANTRSNKEAARWLGITDVTYKKYAKKHIDEATGKSLFELHKNQAGKGMPKNWVGGQWKKNLDDMLVENQPINTKKIIKLKELLMKDGRLGYQCATCKFSEKRLTDMKAPLLLNFVNGKRSDWRIENLRWLCYNCYFLFIEDPFSNKMLQRLEAMPIDAPEIKEDAQELFQLDDFYYDHLKKLGLDGQGDVLFKEPTGTPVDDDELSDLIDFKK
jgi:hypothetical protein